MKNKIGLFLSKKLLRCLGSWKISIMSGPLEDSPALAPSPHLIYLQPSQHCANPVEVTTHEKYKYKYANLAYDMVPQQLAPPLGVGP
jgi:hypothetical protein